METKKERRSYGKGKYDRKPNMKAQSERGRNVPLVNRGKVVIPDGTTIRGVARLKTNKFGMFYKVGHFEVDESSLGNYDYLKPRIESLINKFIIERGITTTTTTYGVVIAHLDLIMEAISAAMVFVRTQNLLQVRDLTGKTLPSAFYNVHDIGSQIVSAEQFYSSYAVSSSNRFNDSITNHAFQTDFISPLGEIMATPHLVAKLAELFMPIHRSKLSEDDEIFHVFWPNSATTYTALKALLSNIAAAYVTYPDLKLILEQLGLKQMKDIGLDHFKRDATQQTILVREDGLSDIIIANSKYKIPFKEYSDSGVVSFLEMHNSYPSTFYKDVFNHRSLIGKQESDVLMSIGVPQYLTAKIFSGGLFFLGTRSVSQYTTGGTNVTETAVTVAPILNGLIGKSIGATAINSGGAAGTGVVNEYWIDHVFGQAVHRGIHIPCAGNEFIQFSKGVNGAITPEVRTQGFYSSTTNLNYSVGNKLSTYDMLDASFYLDNRKLFLFFNITQ